MGWQGRNTAAQKLRGERDWSSGELARMAELAGVTLVQLSAMSDDLQLVKHSESLNAAVLIDEMPPEQRAAALQFLQSIRTQK